MALDQGRHAGEIAGFAVPAVTGVWVAAPGWEMLGGIAPLVRTTLIVVAGAVEGACLGLAQAYALRMALPRIATRDWARATAQGAAIAWTIGALPMALGESLMSWHPAVLGLLGLTLLAAMGLLQGRLSRRHVRGALWWVAATAGSWLAALAVFMLITTPLWQEGQPVWLVLAIGGLGGAAMALTAAGLTGAVLVLLLLAHRASPRPAGAGDDDVPDGPRP